MSSMTPTRSWNVAIPMASMTPTTVDMAPYQWSLWHPLQLICRHTDGLYDTHYSWYVVIPMTSMTPTTVDLSPYQWPLWHLLQLIRRHTNDLKDTHYSWPFAIQILYIRHTTCRHTNDLFHTHYSSPIAIPMTFMRATPAALSPYQWHKWRPLQLPCRYYNDLYDAPLLLICRHTNDLYDAHYSCSVAILMTPMTPITIHLSPYRWALWRWWLPPLCRLLTRPSRASARPRICPGSSRHYPTVEKQTYAVRIHKNLIKQASHSCNH